MKSFLLQEELTIQAWVKASVPPCISPSKLNVPSSYYKALLYASDGGSELYTVSQLKVVQGEGSAADAADAADA